jgi:hypothetical protein
MVEPRASEGKPSAKAATPRRTSGRSRIPPGSSATSRLLAALIIGLAMLTIVLILVATGVLLGVTPYR